MNHSRQTQSLTPGKRIAGILALACGACATPAAAPPAAAPPTATLAPLRGDHQAVVDRLTDQANDLCRVSGKEAKVLQVGTTDLTRDPESRHIVYECLEPPGTDADEASAAPDEP